MIPVIPRAQTRNVRGQPRLLLRSLISRPREEKVGEFERRVADYVGVSEGVACSSCRSAFRALLCALDYEKGAGIIMPSLNYPAIPRTARELGFNVVWLPVREPDLSPDFDALASPDVDGAAALVWPHYFGFPGPVDRLKEFCEDKRMDLLEDCAHALGGSYRGRLTGSLGRASFISFETSKILNTFGGGMALTDDPQLAGRLRESLRLLPPRSMPDVSKGIVKSYAENLLTNRWVYTLTLYPAIYRSKVSGREDFMEEGLGGPAPRKVSRYSPVQAQAGLRLMEYFDDILKELQDRFDAIQGCISDAGMAVPVFPGAVPNGYMTAGVHRNAAEIAAAFLRRGVDVKVRYMQDCRDLGFGTGGGRCGHLAGRLFHLPNPIGFSERSFSHYLETIREVLGGFTSGGAVEC